MSATHLEKLKFQIGVEDFATQSLSKISKGLRSMQQQTQQRFEAFKNGMQSGASHIRNGALGLAASGAGLYGFLKPVYEMQDALGEVRSLGVAESELGKLKQAASSFSTTYGESATDFVRSSYDIQSAIGGLTQGELAKFTTASNVLAKGTKADAATVTSYMGTMYGIFAEQANAMGKAQWVEQLTGQTATAVQMFKTTGSEMSNAFTSLGANAQAAGIQLNEQMAILGTLQATMSGSEAGTKYKSFLAGVGKAQTELGLSFTDSQGQMLPMLSILDTLKGKFGETLDVAESDALKKAFGSDEAVSLIKLLMTQTHGLQTSMQRLGDVRGMEQAERMAKSMTNPWERLGAVATDLQISFGELLLPTINRLLTHMNNGLQTLKGWTEEYPNITRWVGYLALGMLGLAAAASLGSMAFGVAKIAISAFQLAGGLLFSKLALLTGIIGAVAYGAYQLYTHWDFVKQSFMESAWVQKISDGFQSLMGWFREMIEKAQTLLQYLGLMDSDIDATVKTSVVSTHQDQPNSLMSSQLSELQYEPQKNTQLAPLRMNSDVPTASRSVGAQLAKSFNSNKPANQYGDIYIQTDEAPTPEILETWSLLQGG